MKKQIRLKNKSKSLPKYSFGGDLGKYVLNSLEGSTIGMLGMDFYKPKFDYDTMGKLDQFQQAGLGIAQKMVPAAVGIAGTAAGIPGLGQVASGIQDFGKQISNPKAKQQSQSQTNIGGFDFTGGVQGGPAGDYTQLNTNFAKYGGSLYQGGQEVTKKDTTNNQIIDPELLKYLINTEKEYKGITPYVKEGFDWLGTKATEANKWLENNTGYKFQGGQEVQTNDMMPYDSEHLDEVSENLIKFDGPSHDRGGIKTPAGEFDKQETVLKKGVVGNPTPFAFSDNLYLSTEVQKQLGLPTRLANRTIADASKFIENKYESNYKDDRMKRDTKERMKQSLYTKLMNANKIEFAKNREMNGIQNKEDMSFDELNSQYQSGGEILTLSNGAQMTREGALAYAKDNGLHKTHNKATEDQLVTYGFNLYNNRVAGEMRKTNGDTRDLGYDAENPQVTNRTDTQKLNPLVDLGNFQRPASQMSLQNNETPYINPKANYDDIYDDHFQKVKGFNVEEQLKEGNSEEWAPATESPTYKYKGIEYKKVDDEWMWKSNKTGALHKAKNFNDDFIERNNLEPGVDKGYKYTRQKHNITPQKSIQHRTPYEKEVIGGGFPQNFGKKSGLGVKGFDPLHNPYLKTPSKYVEYEDRENPYKNSTKGSKGNVFNPYDNTELSQEEMKRRYEETRTKSLITSEAAVKHGYTKQEEMNKRNLVNASKQELETYEILREDIAKNYHKDNRIKSFVQDHPISSIYANDRSPKAIENYNRMIAQKLHDEAGVKYINPKPRVEIKEQKSYYDDNNQIKNSPTISDEIVFGKSLDLHPLMSGQIPSYLNTTKGRNPEIDFIQQIGNKNILKLNNKETQKILLDFPYNKLFKEDTPDNRDKYEAFIEKKIMDKGVPLSTLYQSGMEVKKYQGGLYVNPLKTENNLIWNSFDKIPDGVERYPIPAMAADDWKEPYMIGKQKVNGNTPDIQRIGYPYMQENKTVTPLSQDELNQKYNIKQTPLGTYNPYEKKDKSNFWNDMSSLEKIGLGANALSTMGQGLSMMKKDTVPTFYNENSSQVNNIMSDRNINMQPIVSRLNAQYNAASSRDNSRSWNTQRGLDSNLYNQFSSQMGELGMKEQEMNNQYKSQYAETLNNLGQQNVQARTQQEELQARTDAARQNALRGLMANTGENLSNFAFTKDFANKTIQEGTNLLKHISTDFGINAENGQDFVKLITSPNAEFLKIKAEAGGYDGPGALQTMLADIDANNKLSEQEKKDLKLEVLAMPLKKSTAATTTKTK